MKGNKKALIYLVGFLVIFGLFIYILLRPSTQALAIKEISTCQNIEDVKAIWYKYRTELFEDEYFKQAVRDQIKSFNLQQKEIAEVKKWLPSKTNNLNIIIVPDLSNRITLIPKQLQNDSILLNTIWESFERKVRLKINSKDQLLVDIADPLQAKNEFSDLADSLYFNLSEHKGKSNRLYFSQNHNRFRSFASKLYQLVLSKGTTGADYEFYFLNKLSTQIKKPTIDDNYRNMVFVLTDGYLEPQKRPSITPDNEIRQKYCRTNNSSDFTYPPGSDNLNLSDIEVYLFEINERNNGVGCDFNVLKKWWGEWFKMMNVKNAEEEFIFRKVDAINTTKKKIQEIIDK